MVRIGTRGVILSLKTLPRPHERRMVAHSSLGGGSLYSGHMLSFAEVAAQHTDLTDDDLELLQRLLDGWEMLADLAFSDLILWLPDRDPQVFWAAAQVRPTTGPTALEEDVVGEDIAYEPDNLVTEAFLSEEIAETSGNKLHAGIPVDQHAVPVFREGRVIAIVEMHTNRMGVRAPGALEEAYLEAAKILRGMIVRGEFPMEGEKPVPWISPRVGDGSIKVNAAGVVEFASPNAVSAFRRLGFFTDLLGEQFSHVLETIPRLEKVTVDHAVSKHLRGPVEFDVENRMAAVRMRVQPLIDEDGPCGYLGMLRDITELKTRERQLVTKDATIREIHHRVKNNLQTVSALLRLQARRATSLEATNALSDAQKRVAAIAVVHEILSQGFDSSVQFDDVADRLLCMSREVTASDARVTASRQGSFGFIAATVATPLSLILTEVVQNAIEHGFRGHAGQVIVQPSREQGVLVVEVTNDGSSLPETFSLGSSSGLGLSIIQTLVADLGGTFALTSAQEGPGTVAVIRIPLK